MISRVVTATRIASRLSRPTLIGDVDNRVLSPKERMLLAPLIYYWMDADRGLQRQKVPAGFIHDGSSKPRVTWTIMGHPFGLSLAPGILHDFAFETRFPLAVAKGAPPERVSFEYSAALYWLFLCMVGASRVQRDLEFLSVLTLPARHIWRRHDEEFAA